MQHLEYTGFIYRWVNSRNGKSYLGSHFGNVSDGYVGSGKYFQRAYLKEPENFQRTILEYHYGNRKELLEKEKEWLRVTVNLADQSSYNLTLSAGGGNNHEHLSPEYRREIYVKRRTASTQRLQSMSLFEKKELRQRKMDTWQRTGKLERMSEYVSRNQKIRMKDPEILSALSITCKDSYWNRTEQENI